MIPGPSPRPSGLLPGPWLFTEAPPQPLSLREEIKVSSRPLVERVTGASKGEVWRDTAKPSQRGLTQRLSQRANERERALAEREGARTERLSLGKQTKGKRAAQ